MINFKVLFLKCLLKDFWENEINIILKLFEFYGCKTPAAIY